jgi:type II restriction enzyme
MPKSPEYIANSIKPKTLQNLINEALYILDKFGLPLAGHTQRRLERIGMAFLAVANVKESRDWAQVKGYDGSHALRS